MMQLVIAVAALAILALLAGNIIVLSLASWLNADTCRAAAQSAAAAYEATASARELQAAIFETMHKKSLGGFFISAPALAELRCFRDKNKKQILFLKTMILVRVPAPFLLIFADSLQDGRFILDHACKVELKSHSLSS